MRTGLTAIRDGGYTHVLLLDGDLQHRPADVPLLVAEAADSGADVVVGARSFDREQMPSSRYYSNVIGSWALGRLIGVRVHDSQSGFRLIRLRRPRGRAAHVDRLRNRDGDADPPRPPGRGRQGSGGGAGLRWRPEQAPTGP